MGKRILTTKMTSLRELWIELLLDRSSLEDKIANLIPLERLRDLREFHLTFSDFLCDEVPPQVNKLEEYREHLLCLVKSPQELKHSHLADEDFEERS